jgi:hypothetical protein
MASDLAATGRAMAALAPGPDAGSPEEQAAEAEIAAAFIRQWKLNQALYLEYGGGVIFQQGGPEPLDAYRQFLEEAAARRDFEIIDAVMAEAFWAYYRDRSRHDFMPAGSDEERRAFTVPPWRQG